MMVMTESCDVKLWINFLFVNTQLKGREMLDTVITNSRGNESEN